MSFPRIKLTPKAVITAKPGGTSEVVKPITIKTTIKLPTRDEIVKTADTLGVTPNTVTDSIENVLQNSPVTPKGEPSPRPIGTTRELHDAVFNNIEDSKEAAEDKTATVLPDDLIWGINRNYVYAGGAALSILAALALARYTNIFK